MENLTLTIGGMSCGHCVRAVDEALKSAEGVTVENVSVGSATLQFDPAKMSAATIAKLVEDEGYKVLSTSASKSRVIA
jgi:copper chaperone CopZ